jgi:hypothetical protein
VIAEITLPGDNSQVAARLLDVAPDGEETLVARGLWRPATGGPTRQVFQLHPNGWTFATGHVAKLELLPADTNPGLTGGYGRASNDQQPVTVKRLELRLPVREKPGSLDGRVGAADERFLPDGEELAADFAALRDRHPKLASRKLKVSGSKLVGRIACPSKWEACNLVSVGATKGGDEIAAGFVAKIRGGADKKLELKLNRRGRKLIGRHAKTKLKVEISSVELGKAVKQKAKAVR